jgi:hypothetical protein
MFVRRVKLKSSTYYYLARRIPGTNKHEFLAKLGSLASPSPCQEDALIKTWAAALIHGIERSSQKALERERLILASREREYGRGFELDKCLQEFRQVYKKYGFITKTLLEKTARPNGEISWGTTTILNQLRNRHLTLKEVFDSIKNEPG